MSFIGQTNSVSSTSNVVLENVPCEENALVGHWVKMLSGVAMRALADNLNNSNVIGLIEFKSSPTTATIRVLGVSEPIFVGLDETKEYLLSSINLGEMSLIAPSLSGEIVLKLGQPFDSQRFLVLKGSMFKRS